MDFVRQRLVGRPRDWINVRSRRFWAVVALLVYALAGFLLVPWIAREQIVDTLGTELERPVRLDELRINPFELSMDARGFSITEPDGSPLLRFDRLFVNFQLSSLFRWAWSFREVTLEQPVVSIVRFPDAETNVGRMLDDLVSEAEDDDTGLVRLVIGRFNLKGGRVRFTDRVLVTPFDVPLGPIDVMVNHISTLPDDEGQQQVVVQTEFGSRVAWSGSLTLQPLHSSGRLEASGNGYVPLVYRYFQDQLAMDAPEAQLEFSFAYDVALDVHGNLRARVEDLDWAVRDVVVRQADTEVLVVPELRIRGGGISYPEQIAELQSLVIADPELVVWREPDGSMNLEHLLAAHSGADDGPPSAESASGESEPDTADPLAGWTLRLAELQLANLQARFEDRTLRRPDTVAITDLDLGLTDVSSDPDARFPLQAGLSLAPRGRLSVEGTVGALPTASAELEISADALGLAVLQPYLAELLAARIDAGTFTLQGAARLTEQTGVEASGGFSFDGLSIADAALGEVLVGWDKVAVDRFEFSEASARLDVSEVSVAAPYVRLVIAADGSTNFQRLMAAAEKGDETDPASKKPPTDASAESEGPSASDVDLTIGRIAVSDGSADFTDLALPIPFRAHIGELAGAVSTLATGSAEPARVDIEGQIADYGLARIEGLLMPLGPTELTDLHVLFRNVALPDMSPYTIRFAGREIADGRMELDLKYRVESGKLTGHNAVVISDLELGERVEHPDAFDLPLALAVALLKGPDGTIDVDVPVSGDVNDPEFRLGGVILKAVINLITRVATAPFRLLGSLVGAESEDFDTIEFEPGLAELTPPEREKLAKLAEALTLRPQLLLQVNGVTDADADRNALQRLVTDARIDQRLQEMAAASQEQLMLSARRRQVIESLYTEDVAEPPIEALRTEFMEPADPAQPEGPLRLDETAYVADLRNRLIASVAIDDGRLTALANERAQAVTMQLTADGAVESQRVLAGATTPVQVDDDGWIPMKLTVTSGAMESNSQP